MDTACFVFVLAVCLLSATGKPPYPGKSPANFFQLLIRHSFQYDLLLRSVNLSPITYNLFFFLMQNFVPTFAGVNFFSFFHLSIIHHSQTDVYVLSSGELMAYMSPDVIL